MLSFTDQMGNTITLNQAPRRIISLVPSQTELLYDLGLQEEVIGITKFCIHPGHWFKTKQRIGGTKKVNINKVRALNPDLIIANKEENVKEQIEALQQFAPVWTSDISNLEQAINMITQLGQVVNKATEAKSLAEKIKTAFAQLPPLYPQRSINNNQLLRSAYLIWRNPYMAAGGDTFIHDMLNYCGFQNIFSQQPRYPEVKVEQLVAANCQLLLLSSEPYPFKEKHIDEMQTQLPNTTIMLVDGEMFSWYGSRLLLAANYFAGLKSQLIQ